MKIIFVCLMAFASLHATAKKYYVSALKGNPKFSGLSAAKPHQTIQAAADLTLPGDTVFVMNGIYTNSCPSCNAIDIVRSGTPDKYIVYTNYPGHKPVIRFNGWAGFSVRSGASYIKIHGFEVIGNNSKVSLAAALKQPAECVSRKGTIDPKFNGNGIVIDGRDGKHPHHITISSNRIHDCGGGGIGAN